MKRMISLVLIALLLSTMVGCSSPPPASSSAPSEPSSSSTPEPEPFDVSTLPDATLELLNQKMDQIKADPATSFSGSGDIGGNEASFFEINADGNWTITPVS